MEPSVQPRRVFFRGGYLNDRCGTIPDMFFSDDTITLPETKYTQSATYVLAPGVFWLIESTGEWVPVYNYVAPKAG